MTIDDHAAPTGFTVVIFRPRPTHCEQVRRRRELQESRSRLQFSSLARLAANFGMNAIKIAEELA